MKPSLTTNSGRSVGLVCSMCPKRRATETTSIEVSPPPTQTTLSAVTFIRPSLNAFKNATPDTQLGVPSHSSRNKPRPVQQPTVKESHQNLFRDQQLIRLYQR